jgi:2-oxoisovalerate dehydrogenase E2 component (dihydrolipoyl transacylase)
MESPVSGVVREVAGEVGDRIPIGSPLAVIETEGGEVFEEPALEAEEVRARIEAETPEAVNEERAVAVLRKTASAQPELVEGYALRRSQAPGPSARGWPAAASGSTGSPRSGGAKVLASPAVRARAQRLGVDLAEVPASLNGIVQHEDLDDFLVSRAAQTPKPPVAKEAPVEKHEPKRPVEPLEGAGEQIKIIGLRRRIAENMAASKRHIPHFTYVEECDVTDLERWRGEFNEQRGDRPKLTLLPFLIAAICRTLPEFPMINARYDDEAEVVTRYDAVHIGMATQTPAGLMVPVIRDAQSLTLWQLAAEISRLADAAREGRAKSEELSGSTLTVTSLGPLGGVATTPVINRPEVTIIGPNKIVERPVYVEGDRLEKRKLMNVSISCDHRVVDGWDAASFVQALKRRIEAPLLMLAG